MQIFGTSFPAGGGRNAAIVLRIVLATVFALIAFIFSEVVPDIPPFNRIFLRMVVTLWFGLMGYGLFPDLAQIVSTATIKFVNNFTSRLSLEITSQMMRIQRPHGGLGGGFSSVSPLGGSVSVNHPLILDTSAIIDGRILDIAKTHFLSGTILVPSFILTELQQVADSADYLKRSRGRRGFEIVDELKKVKGTRIEIWDKDTAGKNPDEKLIKLAKNLHGRLITTDYNLNRLATTSNITVLNINELANSVRAIAIPGESLKIKVVHLGKDAKQGVGYLPDGTMVVVEDGAELVGREIQTEVSRLIQVAAGRMIFVKLRGA
ncbi:twitching motility protein PilT [Candidatus Daviesbacteria bacterium]|nr:twitching motility protein PilT [Candidatus Daviesbacteria bacterium]